MYICIYIYVLVQICYRIYDALDGNDPFAEFQSILESNPARVGRANQQPWTSTMFSGKHSLQEVPSQFQVGLDSI